jgi:hypothetical protein
MAAKDYFCSLKWLYSIGTNGSFPGGKVAGCQANAEVQYAHLCPICNHDVVPKHRNHIILFLNCSPICDL